MLESILSTCIGDSVARAAGVVAPPGMGKSRLRHEFLRRATQRHPELLVLLGRGEIMNVGAPYGMLGQALRRLCGLVGGEPDEVRTERLRERLALRLAGAAATQVVAFLGELCGVRLPDEGSPAMHAARGDPRLMHEQVKLAFVDWLRAECQAGPVLLVLDDLHWGDALTVQLLEQALRELAELPLFVLTLARPEAQEQFPSFWASSALQVLPLQALTRRACERLAQEVLQRALGHAPDAETVARVVAQSAGHPLYLEELIRAVAGGRQDALPETVLAMLMARLSQLDFGARQVLRAASVFGETFTRGGLAALLHDEQPTVDVNATLAMLVRAEFIEPQREGWGTVQERFKFRHALVRDAAYSLLTEENRVILHRLACAHLEQSGGADPAMLAEHAYQGNALELAARFYIEAGQRALSSFDLDAAERHARRAIECGVRNEQLGAVRAIQAWLANFRLDLQGGYAYALEALEILKPGSFWWTKTAAICFYLFFLLDRLEHADRIIRTFLASEPDPDTQLAYLESGAILAILFTATGARRACNQVIDRLTQVAANVDPRDRGYLMIATAWRTLVLEPDPYRALEEARQATALFRESGKHLWLAEALFGLGMALTDLGVWTKGEEVLREAREVARANGDVFYDTVIHLYLGFNLAGQADAAKQEEARRISNTYRDQPQLGPTVQAFANKILADVSMGCWRSGDGGGGRPCRARGLRGDAAPSPAGRPHGGRAVPGAGSGRRGAPAGRGRAGTARGAGWARRLRCPDAAGGGTGAPRRRRSGGWAERPAERARAARAARRQDQRRRGARELPGARPPPPAHGPGAGARHAPVYIHARRWARPPTRWGYYRHRCLMLHSRAASPIGELGADETRRIRAAVPSGSGTSSLPGRQGAAGPRPRSPTRCPLAVAIAARIR